MNLAAFDRNQPTTVPPRCPGNRGAGSAIMRGVDGGDMASVLARLLAALRGSGIPSPGGRDSSRYEPQVRVRARPGAAVDTAPDRNTRFAGRRVRRLRQIAAFYADGAHEAVITIGDCAFIPHDRFHAAAELIVRTSGERAATLVATENAL